jgi:hypothetical protein
MLSVTGLILFFFGALVSVAFWIPKLVNRPRLRSLLGAKYPFVYFIYIANGPLLLILGLFLFLRFG